MSKFNKADVDGCSYTMSVLTPYFKCPVKYEHTSSTPQGEYCPYDMGWTASTHTYAVENKDRRINWKTKEPQYFNTYETIMFNIEKYDALMSLYHSTGTIPLYTAGYSDGVVVFDLRKFPEDCIEKWVGERMIGRNTVEDGAIISQERLFIPKEYGRFFSNQ